MATATRKRSSFGDILRRELDAQNISIRELARRLSASDPDRLESVRRSLSRYVSGRVTPGREAREEIAEALSIDPAVFAEEALSTARREMVLDALAPLADVLLALAVEVAKDRERDCV